MPDAPIPAPSPNPKSRDSFQAHDLASCWWRSAHALALSQPSAILARPPIGCPAPAPNPPPLFASFSPSRSLVSSTQLFFFFSSTAQPPTSHPPQPRLPASFRRRPPSSSHNPSLIYHLYQSILLLHSCYYLLLLQLPLPPLRTLCLFSSQPFVPVGNSPPHSSPTSTAIALCAASPGRTLATLRLLLVLRQ